MSNKEELLSQLGKHEAAKSCVYVKKLGDINIDVLKLVLKNSITAIQNQYAALTK